MIGNVMAMAGLTLKEASRSKIFVVMVLFGAALISSAAFLPVITPEQKLNVIELWAIRVTFVFGCVIAIVVTALALPKDFARRRIFNLASKPIGRPSIFLGRFLGFAAILGIYSLMTFVLTVGYIRMMKAVTGPGFPDLKAEPRLVTRDLRAAWLPGAQPRGMLGQWVKDDQILVTPGAPEVDRRLVWAFSALDASRLPDPVKLEVELEIFASGIYSLASEFYVVVENHGTNERFIPVGQVFLSSNVKSIIEVPRRVLEGGDVSVSLTCANPGYELYAGRDKVAFYENPKSFELNVVKCFTPMFLEWLILMSVSLAASAWVSAPVAMLIGIVVLGLGLAGGFMTKALRHTDAAIRESVKPDSHGHPQDDIPKPILQISAAVTRAVLKIIPNFSVYEQDALLLADVDIPLKSVARVAVNSCLFWLVPAFIGLVLLQFREFQ